MKELIQSLMQNPHTFWAGVAIIVAVVVCNVGPIWFPAHLAQFKATDAMIFRLATGYGFILMNLNKPKTS